MTRVLALMVVLAGAARADRHVVERGETLEHVAATHGCSVDAIERANHLRTSLVKPGTVIELPSCSIKTRARTRAPSGDREKALQALSVIDGASWVAAPKPAAALGDDDGVPWNGTLAHGEKLEAGDGYEILAVATAPARRQYGAPHVIDHLRHVIAEVRALYPDVHTLAIGDLSAEHGGKISSHKSHQSGLDVDVGFYFTHVPAGYPDAFASGDGPLDFEATWALLAGFARTAGDATGVEMIFLDYGVQHRIYDWARTHGVPDAELDAVFQYPHGQSATTGLVRHWPNHTDHFHVRFKPSR